MARLGGPVRLGLRRSHVTYFYRSWGLCGDERGAVGRLIVRAVVRDCTRSNMNPVFVMLLLAVEARPRGVIPCTVETTNRCCGDGKCNGPETIENCMADCPGVTTTEQCGEEVRPVIFACVTYCCTDNSRGSFLSSASFRSRWQRPHLWCQPPRQISSGLL